MARLKFRMSDAEFEKFKTTVSDVHYHEKPRAALDVLWEEMGERRGFDWKTVQHAPEMGSSAWFTAEETRYDLSNEGVASEKRGA